MSEDPIKENEKKGLSPFSLRKLGAQATIALIAPGVVGHNILHSQSATAATMSTAKELVLKKSERPSAKPSQISTPLLLEGLQNTGVHERRLQGLMPSRTIEQLPGYGKKVGTEVRKELRDSQIQLTRQKRGGGFSFPDYICNGFLMNVNGKIRVVTATHCAEDITHNQTGLFGIGTGPFRNHQPAVNLVHTPDGNAYKWGIEDAQNNPLATINGWSIKPNSDASVLSIDPSTETPALKKLRPLKATSLANNTPELGQEVASIGVGYNSRKPIMGTGVLLGTEIQQGRTVYIVGARVPDQENGPYQYGVSGMAFRTADGHILGPDSQIMNRNLTDDSIELIMQSHKDITTPAEARARNTQSWKQMEMQLNLKLPKEYSIIFVQKLTASDAGVLESGLR